MSPAHLVQGKSQLIRDALAHGEAGFEESRCTVSVPGAFCEYTGRKPKRIDPIRAIRS